MACRFDDVPISQDAVACQKERIQIVVLLASRALVRGFEYLLLAINLMRNWVLSTSGDKWSVKLDVRDLGGHMDTT